MTHMRQEDAVDLLDQVARVRRSTRLSVGALWFPLVLFGFLSLVSGAVSWRVGADALGAYWLVAAPIGSVATSLFYRRRERRVGLEMPAGPALLAVAVIILGAFGTGALGGALGAETLSAVGPPLFVSIGYLMFARLERSLLLGGVAAGLAVTALAVAVAGMAAAEAATLLAVVYGVTLMLTGLAYRIRAGQS